MAEDVVEGNAAAQDAAASATAGEAVGGDVAGGGDGAPAEDVIGNMITETKNARKRNLLLVEVAVIVIAVVVIASFALVYIHPAARAVTASSSTALTTIPQGPANSSVAGLVAQLNHTWNTTDMNSSISNSSYDMIGTAVSLG